MRYLQSGISEAGTMAELTIDKLEKSYGKGAVMKLSDERVEDIPAISTGSLGLDIALGIVIYNLDEK